MIVSFKVVSWYQEQLIIHEKGLKVRINDDKRAKDFSFYLYRNENLIIN